MKLKENHQEGNIRLSINLTNISLCSYSESYRFQAKNQNYVKSQTRKAIMENWNHYHPERYSNFHGLFVEFQFCRKWPWTW